MSRKWRSLVGVALLAMAGMGTAGTGGAVAAAAQSGGNMTVLISTGGLTAWPGLDPLTTSVANGDYRDSIYGQLFEEGAHNNVVGGLAKSYKLSADGKTLTIHLRSNIKFSDGTPLDAAAVQFNLQRDFLPANACQCLSNFKDVSSVTTSGTDTVVLHLSAPDPSIVPAFIAEAPNWIASPTALKKQGAANFAQHPVGAGPFVVSSNIPSQKLVLSKNPTYYQKGHPFLNSATFEAVGSDQSALSGLQANSGQMVEGVTTTPLIVQAKKSFNVIPVAPTAVWFLDFDATVAPFTNPLAREAIEYATDSKSIDKALYDNLLPADEGPEASGALFFDPTVPGYRAYNPPKAAALVKKLGGLKVTIMTGPELVDEQATSAMKAMWSKVGIDVTAINAVQLPNLIKNYGDHNWQLYYGFVPGGLDPASTLSLFYTPTGPETGVNDPTLTSMLAKAATNLDMSSRAKQYHAISAYINKNAYSDFLYQNETFFIASKNVAGIPAGRTFINWANVSLSGQ